THPPAIPYYICQNMSPARAAGMIRVADGGFEMYVRRLGLCFIGILAIQSAALADYSIISSKSDFEPRVGLGSTGPNGVYTTTPSVTANNLRIGISGGSTNR